MLDLSAEGINEYGKRNAKRLEILTNLTAQNFDMTNSEHLRLLKKYNDEFELIQNQMYLFNGMSVCLWLWAGSFVTHFFLPIPDFSSYFLTLGLMGSTLAHFGIKDFHLQLEELKTVYNWCLKQKVAVHHYQYDGVTKNNDKLEHPEIQRLVHLLAPMCTYEFMQAWPEKASQEPPVKGILDIIADAGKSFFPSRPIYSAEIKTLMRQVETNALTVSTFEGFQQSLRYFATNTTFRKMIEDQIPEAVRMCSPKSFVELMY